MMRNDEPNAMDQFFTHYGSTETQQRTVRDNDVTVRPQHSASLFGQWWYRIALVASVLLAVYAAYSWWNTPSDSQPSSTAVKYVTPEDRNETHLELDLSEGKGEHILRLLVPSEQIVVRADGHGITTAEKLVIGDRVQLNEGFIGIVNEAEKYVPKPEPVLPEPPHGTKYERVVGWVKRTTDTLLYLQTTDELIKTTPEHPFKVKGKGWVEAGDLEKGDQIETLDDRFVFVVSTEVRRERETVYNLRVEGSNTYFVGEGMLLVHNGGPCVPKLREPTRFIAGAKIKSHGKVISEGTVDLKPTLDRIAAGKKFPHRNDGTIFQNRPPKGKTTPELPVQPKDYYTEYVVPTAGVNGPGPQRLVIGKGGDIWYTPDHYESFIPVNLAP